MICSFLPFHYDASYDSLFFQVGWLNAIREWQEEFVGNMSSREFVDTITRDLLGSRVFVFTPKGEVRTTTPQASETSSNVFMILLKCFGILFADKEPSERGHRC